MKTVQLGQQIHNKLLSPSRPGKCFPYVCAFVGKRCFTKFIYEKHERSRFISLKREKLIKCGGISWDTCSWGSCRSLCQAETWHQ